MYRLFAICTVKPTKSERLALSYEAPTCATATAEVNADPLRRFYEPAG
jgi:hypothetical protein